MNLIKSRVWIETGNCGKILDWDYEKKLFGIFNIIPTADEYDCIFDQLEMEGYFK